MVFDWKQEQKEMVEKGLVTMEDVEMASAEGKINIQPPS